MAEATGSLSKHCLDLARELLDDIELSKLSPEQLLLKTMRLARIRDDEDTRTWLNYELKGYPNTDSGQKFMSQMGRWTDKKKGHGYWMPFGAIDGMIASDRAQIQQFGVPNVSLSFSSANPNEFVAGIGRSAK